jgi:hypothetical protein
MLISCISIKTAETANGSNLQLTKVKTRILAGAIGGGIIALGILLQGQLPHSQREVQIAVWTMFVILFVVGPNFRHIRARWFLKASLLGAGIHTFLVFWMFGAIPFSSIGVVIIISIPEAVFILLMFREMSRKEL